MYFIQAKCVATAFLALTILSSTLMCMEKKMSDEATGDTTIEVSEPKRPSLLAGKEGTEEDNKTEIDQHRGVNSFYEYDTEELLNTYPSNRDAVLSHLTCLTDCVRGNGIF